jgi:hypothetical protein
MNAAADSFNKQWEPRYGVDSSASHRIASHRGAPYHRFAVGRLGQILVPRFVVVALVAHWALFLLLVDLLVAGGVGAIANPPASSSMRAPYLATSTKAELSLAWSGPHHCLQPPLLSLQRWVQALAPLVTAASIHPPTFMYS